MEKTEFYDSAPLNERYAFKLNAELNGAQRVDGGERVQNHAHLLVVHRQQ